MSMHPSLNQPCTLCSRPTSMWCSRCQSAWYCTPDHLGTDWPRHRKECVPVGQNYSLQQQQQLQQQVQQPQVQVQHQQQPLTSTHAHYHQQQSMHSPPTAYDDVPRNPSVEPGFHSVSAILFDPEAERARLVDIMCRPSHKPTEGICPVPMVHSHFPDNIAEGIVLTQGLNGEPLRFPLNLWYSPTCLQKSAPVNRAIAHVTAGANAKPWCGPVVVLKFNGSRRQGYADAGSNDLPALSAYFLAYK